MCSDKATSLNKGAKEYPLRHSHMDHRLFASQKKSENDQNLEVSIHSDMSWV